MSRTPGLNDADLAALDDQLADDDAARTAAYPGDRVDRQPVHTVYVPADRFHPDLAAEWGAAALAALDKDAPGSEEMASATGLELDAVQAVWAGVLAKLGSEPIEDLRVDLEDGYGNRSDEDEDRHAVAAGEALATAINAGTAPPFLGIRFKCLEGPTRRRGLRSLDLVLGALLAQATLPAGWVVTLPKVTSTAQVGAMVDVCGRLERAYGLDAETLTFEIQVETTQAVLLADGRAAVAAMVHAAAGRCSGLHFGTYDYTASLGIASGYQAMDHPSADHAKAIMQLAAAGTGARVSDGSTNIIPVGRAIAYTRRGPCTPGSYSAPWSVASTRAGICIPRSFPPDSSAPYLFFRADLDGIGGRLNAFIHGAEGGVMDEPATAQALAAFLLRGIHCGAVSADEVRSLTGAELDAVTALARPRSG